MRPGYTLIEVISAMTAASLLVVALVSCIGIATSVVEPADEENLRDRDQMIVERLRADLRYAIRVSDGGTSGFQLQRPNGAGSNHVVSYENSTDGLTRTINGQSELLSADVASLTSYVDGFSAASRIDRYRLRPRIRGVSTAATDGSSVDTLTIQVPAGARPGDLLMLVCGFQDTDDIVPVSSGWARSHFAIGNGLGVAADFHMMDVDSPATLTIAFLPFGNVAATMLAIENAAGEAPFGWSGSGFGTSDVLNPNTFPEAIEDTAEIDEESLNLKFFAATGDPMTAAGTLLPAFVDASVATATRWGFDDCTLGTTFRSGPMPSLSFVPRVNHEHSSSWVTLAVEIAGALP